MASTGDSAPGFRHISSAALQPIDGGQERLVLGLLHRRQACQQQGSAGSMEGSKASAGDAPSRWQVHEQQSHLCTGLCSRRGG